MKGNPYIRLETNSKFKRSKLPPFFWIHYFVVVPPTILLFFAIFGFIYLSNDNQLISYASIPLLIILLISTIWLRAVKQLIVKKEIGAGLYLVCLAKVVSEDGKNTQAIFSTGDKRHDTSFLSDILHDKHDFQFPKKRQRAYAFCENSKQSTYTISFLTSAIKKKNPNWESSNCFPILFINEKRILLLSQKELQMCR